VDLTKLLLSLVALVVVVLKHLLLGATGGR
jgi:hypothetical protein